MFWFAVAQLMFRKTKRPNSGALRIEGGQKGEAVPGGPETATNLLLAAHSSSQINGSVCLGLRKALELQDSDQEVFENSITHC